MNHNAIKILILLLAITIVFSQGLAVVAADNNLTHCVYEDSSELGIACLPFSNPDISDEEFIDICESNNEEDTQVAYINKSEPLDFSQAQWEPYNTDLVVQQCELEDLGCDCNNPEAGFVTYLPGMDFTNISDINEDTCVAYCEPSQQTYNLTGTVTENNTDEVLEGVNINVNTASPTLTDENGEYSITLLPGNYEIVATLNACEQQTEIEISDSNRQVNFVFSESCSLNIPPIEDDPDEVDFPGIGNTECGDPDFEIVYDNDCIPGEPPEFKEGLDTCEARGYESGELLCSQSCTVNTDSCIEENNEDEDLICSTDGVFNLEKVGFTYGITNNLPGFNVTLSINPSSECRDDEAQYEIDKCVTEITEDGEFVCADDKETIFTGNLNNNRNHVDSNPFGTDSNNVCYYLSVNDGLEEKELCVSKPASFCSDKQAGDYCDGDNIVTCDEDGFVNNTQTCSDGRCGESMVDQDPVAYCLANDDLLICDMCNGLFGMHAANNNLGGNTYEVTVGDTLRNIMSCNTGYGSDSNNAMAGICYADSYTSGLLSTASFDLCPDINSCYDYKAQGSCEANPCGNSLAQNCVWNDVSADLGTGVCAPEEIELLECERCNEDDRNCTENLCDAHGSECYYSTANYFSSNNINSCVSPNRHVCEMYNNKNDCVGEGDIRYEGDINYNGDLQFGNHTRTQLSGDYNSLGLCAWNDAQESCRRDAGLRFSNGNIANPDCAAGDMSCLTDFEKPSTSTNIQNGGVYSGVQLNNLVYVATDNTYRMQETPGLESRFILEKTDNCDDRTFTYEGNQYCYPTLDYDDFSSSLTFEPGSTRLFYYTRDGSYNFEQIQSLRFRIVETLQNVISGSSSVNYERVSTGFQADILLELNVENGVNYPENEVTCDIKLSKVDAVNDENILIRERKNIRIDTDESTQLFKNRESGSYDLDVYCIDSYEQQYNETFSVDVDSDNILNQVKPRGEVFNVGQEININLTTIRPAQCQYTMNQNVPLDTLDGDPIVFPEDSNELDESVEWLDFDTNNNFHNATISVQNQEGLYLVVPRCHFEIGDIEFTYYGLDPNLFYYAIDDSPPVFQVLEGSELYNNSQASEGVFLKLNVTDLPRLRRNGSNKVYNHKVNKIEYCITEVGGFCDYEPYNLGDVIEVQAPSEPSETYLRVRVTDNGGNTLERTEFVNLTNSNFEKPRVEICDGDLCYGEN